MSVPHIARLDEAVVNRIAAGEVVQRPDNAVKELLENALDAGADSITITVKDGGLKLLQIKDSGHGIRKEDLAIVCERFTTSKLKQFEDLQQIATFGFRGEALSSISHISHVTITTMTRDDQCAWKASYKDGVMLTPEPLPSAGVKGTTIHVEDLFYNVPARLKVLNRPQEEHVRIMKVVSCYALHYHNVAFTLARQNVTTTDLRTRGNCSQRVVIRELFGAEMEKNLLEVKGEWELPNEGGSEEGRASWTLHGFVTGPAHSARKGEFILFINSRLVDCKPLKAAIDAHYRTLLMKQTHAFVTLALTLPPHIVDVNVHPTKREVRFLHQDAIISKITEQVVTVLQNATSTRTFYTQTLLVSDSSPAPTTSSRSLATPLPQYNVRVDPKEQPLTAFYSPPPSKLKSNIFIFKEDDPDNEEAIEEDKDEDTTGVPTRPRKRLRASEGALATLTPRRRAAPIPRPAEELQLTSVRNLLSVCSSSSAESVKALCSNGTYVGVVDKRVLIQHGPSLYLCLAPALAKALVYQRALQHIPPASALAPFTLTPPPPLIDLLLLADDMKLERATELCTELCSEMKKALLTEYFHVHIDSEARLVSLPQILGPEWRSPLVALPKALCALGTSVNWRSEQQCLHDIATILAVLYCEPVTDTSAVVDGNAPSFAWLSEHVLLPELRNHFDAPKSLAEEGDVVRIASLDKLYKVFERC